MSTIEIPSWREAVNNARSMTLEECRLEMGTPSEDWHDDGYGVAIDGVDCVDKATGARYRIRYVTVTTKNGGAVAVPLIDGHIVFLLHYRASVDKFLWELPRGFTEKGETRRETVERELSEELGLTADASATRNVGHIHGDAGISRDDTDVFIVKPCETLSEAAVRVGDDWEASDIALVPLDDIRQFIREAPVECGITLAALELAWCDLSEQ